MTVSEHDNVHTGELALPGIRGSRAIVTGGAGGIGQGIAYLLGSLGAEIAVIDINEEGAAATRQHLADEGCRAIAAKLDLGEYDRIDPTVEKIEQELGPIDFLVNAAGVFKSGDVLSFKLEDFDWILRVNLTGTFGLTQSVARRMATRRRGSIVTITSNVARVPRIGQCAYAPSKAGLSHLMRVVGLELAAKGIRCNCVAPGSTETEMVMKMVREVGLGEQLVTGSLEHFRVGVPLGKNAQVADIANAAAFLLSDLAGHITMEEVVVDGGGALGA